MATLKVRGYEFESFNLKSASQRKAVQLRNNLFASLKKVGVSEDDVEIDLEPVVIKKVQAFISWYMEGQHLYFSYKGLSFIENLYVVSKIIELEVTALLDEKKTIREFIAVFSEDRDIESKRKEARETLGVSEESVDWDEIDKKYK